jgi:hypothetical protein
VQVAAGTWQGRIVRTRDLAAAPLAFGYARSSVAGPGGTVAGASASGVRATPVCTRHPPLGLRPVSTSRHVTDVAMLRTFFPHRLDLGVAGYALASYCSLDDGVPARDHWYSFGDGPAPLFAGSAAACAEQLAALAHSRTADEIFLILFRHSNDARITALQALASALGLEARDP